MTRRVPSVRRAARLAALGALAATTAACAASPRAVTPGAPSPVPSRGPAAATQPAGLPGDAEGARARLDRSPRHGEWQMVRVPGANGTADSVRAWVVYPERSTKAPVVLVVHEIFGLSTWVRGVADQLAAEGFIAVAPDLLTGKMGNGNPDSLDVQAAVAQIRRLDPAEVQRRLAGLGAWATQLPAASGPKYGIVGFCWGGSTVFEHAVAAPGLGASLGAGVAYYGAAPKPEALAPVQAPILALLAGDDARVNMTIPAADSALRAAGKTFEQATYPGAGHGFLRQQTGREGANLAASQAAWPRTVQWFRRHLEGR